LRVLKLAFEDVKDAVLAVATTYDPLRVLKLSHLDRYPGGLSVATTYDPLRVLKLLLDDEAMLHSSLQPPTTH
jgi:hypothetical protein